MRAMLDGKRGICVVDQVGTGSHVRQHSRQDIGVPDGPGFTKTALGAASQSATW